MERSQLLEIISAAMQKTLQGKGLWQVMAVVALAMGAFANFVSSVVAAVITLPIIAQVGKQLGSPAGLILSTTLVYTAAMALPVSSFPNANSFAVRRAGGGGNQRGAFKFQLSAEQKAEIRGTFDRFDADKNGHLDVVEVHEAMKTLGFNPRNEEVTRIVESLDHDGSGTIDFTEFEQTMTHKFETRARARAEHNASGAYLTVQDFVVAGGLVTFMALGLMLSLGYASVRVLGL
mmetsp:Transcript_30080/g.79437  ORF Transcript_30080/g.79437 Transcript_30080/m.79437 type:complete len:234 (-) Transcript_30080:187-888(-)